MEMYEVKMHFIQTKLSIGYTWSCVQRTSFIFTLVFVDAKSVYALIYKVELISK